MRLLLALVVLVAGLAAPVQAAPVRSATVVVGHGVDVKPRDARVELGMTRRALVAALGAPVSRNAFGYFAYARKRVGIFDVFVNPTTRRVDLVVVSLPDTCLASGICLFEPGGLGRLREKFGRGLHRVVEPSGVRYRVRGKLGERPVVTDFEADGEQAAAQLVSIALSLPS